MSILHPHSALPLHTVDHDGLAAHQRCPSSTEFAGEPGARNPNLVEARRVDAQNLMVSASAIPSPYHTPYAEFISALQLLGGEQKCSRDAPICSRRPQKASFILAAETAANALRIKNQSPEVFLAPEVVASKCSAKSKKHLMGKSYCRPSSWRGNTCERRWLPEPEAALTKTYPMPIL